MSERKQRMPGFVGPSYQSRAKRFDNQRLVNYYIEMDELGGGKGQEPAVLIGTPGLKFLQSIGAGPIRATYTLSNQQVSIVVTGNEVYQISGSLGIPVAIVGNLNTSTGPISIADNGVQCLMVDGTDGYYFDIGTPILNTISDPNFYPADTVTFQDGYFILNQNGTTNFFISDLYSVDFLPLNQAAKAGNSDILVAVISNNRQLYLLGANTLEIWYDAGVSGSTPFQRQDGRFSQVGCASPFTPKILGESFFWLGSNAQGGGVVYTLENAMPQRVSTHAVEYAIQNYSNLAGSTAYSYQQEGHYYFCLNIPGANTTWVYDVSCKQWAERQSTELGNTGRHFGETHCVLNTQHIVGDYRNGNIYEYDLDTYTDNGGMILRIRQSPHTSEVGNRMFYKLFEVDFQFGVGLPDVIDIETGISTIAAANPRVTLEISNDGGQSWSNPIFASMGAIGQWNHRARWQRLGSSRDRIFRVVSSEPVKTQMLAAWLDVEVGSA